MVWTKGSAGSLFLLLPKQSSHPRRPMKKSTSPHVRYAYYRKFAYLHIQEKYNIMASQLLLAVPEMKRKDPRRKFSEPERLAFYDRG